jgi:hypothetical protein
MADSLVLCHGVNLILKLKGLQLLFFFLSDKVCYLLNQYHMEHFVISSTQNYIYVILFTSLFFTLCNILQYAD